MTEHETQHQGDPTTSESTQAGSELQAKKKKLELFLKISWVVAAVKHADLLRK